MKGVCEPQAEGPDQELDPIQVQQERREALEYMVKTLQMFEFGSLQEACRSVGGKAPTTTKWVEKERSWTRVCEMSGASFQAKTSRTEGGLVRGDATAGSEEGTLRIRGRGAREAAVALTGGGEADVRRREGGEPQRSM